MYLHRLKITNKKNVFYYCSFCGYNHRYRTRIIIHIAKYHSKINPSNNLIPCHVCSFKKKIYFENFFFLLV